MAVRAKYEPSYEKESGWVTHRYEQSTGDTLRFAARDVRHERTGIHARVSISLNWVSLAMDNFNIERDKDRTHVLNAALKRLKLREYRVDMLDVDVHHGFDLFCEGLWAETLRGSVGEMMAGDDTKPVRQLVRGLVIEGGGTIIFAPPGRGKTTTLLAMAVCLDAGLSIYGCIEVVQPEPVLFINLERSRESLAYRLAHTNRALGLEPGRPMAFMNERGKNLSDIYEAAQETMARFGCRVVCLDSLSRAGDGSLSDDDKANRTMDKLNALAPTWILSAHTPRQDTTHAFGSQMFDAAEDVGVQLISQTRNGVNGVGLQVVKENDLGPQPMRMLAYEWDASGLALVRPARKGEFPEIEAGKRQSLEEDIEELLLLRGQLSGARISTELGRQRPYVAKVLNSSDRFTVVGREGHEVLYGVRTKKGEA